MWRNKSARKKNNTNKLEADTSPPITTGETIPFTGMYTGTKKGVQLNDLVQLWS